MSENAWIDSEDAKDGIVWGPWIRRYDPAEDPRLYCGDYVEVDLRSGEQMEGTVDEFNWEETGGGTIIGYRICHVGPWEEVSGSHEPDDVGAESYVEVENALTQTVATTQVHDVIWDNVSRYRHVSQDHAKGKVYAVGS